MPSHFIHYQALEWSIATSTAVTWVLLNPCTGVLLQSRLYTLSKSIWDIQVSLGMIFSLRWCFHCQIPLSCSQVCFGETGSGRNHNIAQQILLGVCSISWLVWACVVEHIVCLTDLRYFFALSILIKVLFDIAKHVIGTCSFRSEWWVIHRWFLACFSGISNWIGLWSCGADCSCSFARRGFEWFPFLRLLLCLLSNDIELSCELDWTWLFRWCGCDIFCYYRRMLCNRVEWCWFFIRLHWNYLLELFLGFHLVWLAFSKLERPAKETNSNPIQIRNNRNIDNDLNCGDHNHWPSNGVFHLASRVNRAEHDYVVA